MILRSEQKANAKFVARSEALGCLDLVLSPNRYALLCKMQETKRYKVLWYPTRSLFIIAIWLRSSATGANYNTLATVSANADNV